MVYRGRMEGHSRSKDHHSPGADKLSKLTAAIDKLDKSQANVVAAIEVFTAFSKYLEFRAKTDPEVTLEFIKKVNKLQDGFLIESFNKGALVEYGD